MKSLTKEIRRSTADGIVEAVATGGCITLPTLHRLLALLDAKTRYRHHIEVAVNTGALLKTVDNEADALETIRRLEAAPTKEVTHGAPVERPELGETTERADEEKSGRAATSTAPRALSVQRVDTKGRGR